MPCKSKCVEFKATVGWGQSHYDLQHKRCQICEIFMKWDGLWCPCCGYRLRSARHHKKNLKFQRCFKCWTRCSLRGRFLLWYKDENKNTVCWKCWSKTHFVTCVRCKKIGRLLSISSKDSFIMANKNEILCKKCTYFIKVTIPREIAKRIQIAMIYLFSLVIP